MTPVRQRVLVQGAVDVGDQGAMMKTYSSRSARLPPTVSSLQLMNISVWGDRE